MLKSDRNPGAPPIEVFDGLRAQLAANRAQFYRDVPIPFYGCNRPGATISHGVVDNWWRQRMMGGAIAHYECIKVFSETDFTEDLMQIDQPTLVMHGDDDQIVPISDAAPWPPNCSSTARSRSIRATRMGWRRCTPNRSTPTCWLS